VGTGRRARYASGCAAAFTLGADYVLTGSINQISAKAETAKEMLAAADIADVMLKSLDEYSLVARMPKMLFRAGLVTSPGSRTCRRPVAPVRPVPRRDSGLEGRSATSSGRRTAG
jgi:hypothetical protein